MNSTVLARISRTTSKLPFFRKSKTQGGKDLKYISLLKSFSIISIVVPQNKKILWYSRTIGRKHLSLNMYNANRKEFLGAYLTRFYKEPDLWPEDLKQWFSLKEGCMTPTQRSRGLTVALLLEYMGEVTGLDLSLDYYLNKLGDWGRWHRSDRGGDDAVLVIALARSEIVVLDNGVVLDTPDAFVGWLLGH